MRDWHVSSDQPTRSWPPLHRLTFLSRVLVGTAFAVTLVVIMHVLTTLITTSLTRVVCR